MQAILKKLQELDQLFKEAKSSVIAAQQKAYMRDQFPFLGIPKPLRAELQKRIWKGATFSREELLYFMGVLWEREEREYHYAACDLAYGFRKLIGGDLFSLCEKMIREKSWWDTVDFVAVKLLGELLFQRREMVEKMDLWIEDPYLWIRRAALLFQLKWKGETEEERLYRYCRSTMGEKDFFLRKAIGWVLREYSKTRPFSVRGFMEENRFFLSPLSVREGSKYL